MPLEPGPIQSASIACVRCGYDLSGSAVGGSCPECGTPVAQSIRRHSSGAQGTGSAVTCMVLGILSLVVCAVLGPFAVSTYYTYLRQVESGEASAEGMAMAKAGLITGWIGTALLILQCLIFGLMFASSGF